MALSRKGVSRQIAHNKIKELSHQTAKDIKVEGAPNDLIDRMRKDKYFEPIVDQLDSLLDPKAYVGRSPQQVSRFTGPGGEVQKALEKYEGQLKQRVAVNLKV